MDGTNLTALVALFVSAVNLLENKRLRAKLEKLESKGSDERRQGDDPA